jgi:hypothetical protein
MPLARQRKKEFELIDQDVVRQSPRFDRAGGWDFRRADATGWSCMGTVHGDRNGYPLWRR